MWILNLSLRIIDWFIPDAAKSERSELNLARNFVFTHLAGPLLSQSISVFLYLSDPDPGFACWTVIICIWMFWTLPFVYKWTGKLQQTAIVTVELLAFTSLFGAYYYGGVSSPFLPWLIVSLLLGFFYLSKSPSLVVALFTFNILVFCGAHFLWGFPELVSKEDLATVGWISILAATIYMSWMAIYYANMMSMSSEIERETESHRETALRLREAKDMADVANRTKSIFLAKMSHELRTPLNAVIGFSEILLENAEFGGKGESKKADLQRINAAGQHLLSLVTDVLDLSKIESNFIELKTEQFDLHRDDSRDRCQRRADVVQKRQQAHREMCRRSRNCFDRCDQVAAGDAEFAEQRREIYRTRDDHAIGVSPKKSGRGLDRDSGSGYRDRHRAIGPFKSVPEFWSGQSHHLHEIWRNADWGSR